MANNTTSLGSPWPENFWEDLVTSFTVSMAIGLVIGGLIWALLVCLSRRRASARISQWSPGRRQRGPHGLGRSGLYRQGGGGERRSNLSLASLAFQRQAPEPAHSFPRKPSFRGSTFHPFVQCPPLPVDTDSQLVTLPASSPARAAVGTHSLGRPHLHWAGSGPRAGLATLPPPAYESIVKAFPDC
ncbi:myc target protein 1 [Ctenodactylus gundi]